MLDKVTIWAATSFFDEIKISDEVSVDGATGANCPLVSNLGLLESERQSWLRGAHTAKSLRTSASVKSSYFVMSWDLRLERVQQNAASNES